MIPLRDSARSRSFPVVNVGLISLSVLVFVRELSFSQSGLTRFLETYALNPARVAEAVVHLGQDPAGALPVAATLVSATFLHGGWTHLIGNMLYLYIFGDNVEDRLGHFRYLVFYLLAGAIGFLVHGLIVAPDQTPTIGASGAIAGVLGAYFVMFPRSRVLTLIFLGFFIQVIEIPSFIFLVVWFGLQLVNGLTSLSASGMAETVAWWAHVGGFASGVLVGLFFRVRPRPRPTRDQPW
ncbi:MAG TPA: rhomboid family intramembrane serine protease [Bacillota bacterium]